VAENERLRERLADVEPRIAELELDTGALPQP